MIQKRFLKLISTLLSLVLLFQLLPMQIFASGLENSTQETSIPSAQQKPVMVVGENEALRTSGVKHFHLSDGSSVAVSYGTAVHYQDENGQWVEIDNRPVLNSEQTVYASRNGDRITAYAANLSSGQILSTGFGNVAVSMSVLDTTQAQSLISGQLQANSQAQLVTQGITFNRVASAQPVPETQSASRTAGTDESTQGWSIDELMPEGLSASVLYEDVFPGVDLQYTAYSRDIK